MKKILTIVTIIILLSLMIIIPNLNKNYNFYKSDNNVIEPQDVLKYQQKHYILIEDTLKKK